MRFALPAMACAAALLAAPAAADVRLTMADGHVSLSATDATIAQILTEWSRVGHTRIVNVERLSTAPVTIELKDVPEAQALDIVLRTVSGYLAAPRATTLANASHFDRIYLLPTSAAAPARPTPVTARPAPFQQAPGAQPDDQESDADAPPARPSAPPPRGPAFSSFPQPRQEPDRAEPAESAPVTYPPSAAPAGAPTPGMLVPAPRQAGQDQPGR
ncbi:MAG: hypothetical protein AB7Q29_10845 [Vicinamibacterales bacterium]